MKKLWLSVWLAVGTSCAVPMGGACESSDQCVDEGVCLKGVCSGYACGEDSDCAADMVCGDVLGASACVYECSADADCLGEQACESVTSGDGAEEHLYCL